jgi:hypothetical protein
MSNYYRDIIESCERLLEKHAQTAHLNHEGESTRDPLARLGLTREQVAAQTAHLRRENWKPGRDWQPDTGLHDILDFALQFLGAGFDSFSLADANRFGFHNHSTPKLRMAVRGGVLTTEPGRRQYTQTLPCGKQVTRMKACLIYKRGPNFPD